MGIGVDRSFGRDGVWHIFYPGVQGAFYGNAWWVPGANDGKGAYIVVDKERITIHLEATNTPPVAGPFDSLDAAKAAYLVMFSGG